ncbi:MAG: FAD-binding oxidoreductase [bacterium]|nr:FAD-binding oxidoreductase [bacterium]
MSVVLQNIPSEIMMDSDRFLSGYEIDGVKPGIAVRPENSGQISDILKEARNGRYAIITRGGGTKINSGNAASDYDIALDLSGIEEIIEYDPSEFLLITGPGITIDKINKALKENGQFLALNPPLPDKATIGGTLSSNTTGYFRESYGTARDLTLGLKFINTAGELIRSGGIVAKNVTGYDLTRLMIGSYGTLGIISEISMRISPVPEHSSVITAGFSSIDNAFSFTRELNNSHIVPSGIIVLDRISGSRISDRSGVSLVESDYTVICGLEGIPETVDWQKYEIKRTAEAGNAKNIDDLEGKLKDRLLDAIRDYPVPDGDEIILKISLPIHGSPDILNYINSSRDDIPVDSMTYVKSGIVYIHLPYDDLTEGHPDKYIAFTENLREYSGQSHGFLNIDSAPVWFKQKINMWSVFPGGNVMRKIKQKFDPENILNPGRFIKIP